MKNTEEKDINDIKIFAEVIFIFLRAYGIYFLNSSLVPKFSVSIYHFHNQNINNYFLRYQINLFMV